MRILLFLFVFLGLLPLASAHAEEYYVELGRAASEEEAQTMFADLQAKNKALADYDVFPNAILQEDGGFLYRVQAGPMLDKEEARRVCGRLMRKKVNCFIIEGFDPQKPKSFAKPAKLTSNDFQPPWVQRSAPAPEPVVEEKSSGGFFDSITSIFDSGPSEEKKEEAPAPVISKSPAKEAKVDVAEAIPVALSSDQQSQDSVAIGAPVEIAENSAPAERAAVTPGWLNVQPFIDEDRAERFWSGVQKRAGSKAGGLSMRVVRPVVSDVPKVIANIGRFLSETEAVQFCRDYVVTASRYLECQFSTAPTEGESAVSVSNPASVEGEEENSLYWVEVLNAKSQDAALEQWEKIRTDNDDLLADVRSQITTSLSKPGVYVVRVGPLNARSKAISLCNSLKSRKLACKLVSL